MERPQRLRRAIWLSAALNVGVFFAVGVPVALRWGGDVGDPVALSPAWPSRAPAARGASLLLALANGISYALDSIPLARFCQRVWAPDFDDGWRARDVLTCGGRARKAPRLSRVAVPRPSPPVPLLDPRRPQHAHVPPA